MEISQFEYSCILMMLMAMNLNLKIIHTVQEMKTVHLWIMDF